ncbi:reductive dehalogenase [Dehalogenimonas formicexedens]|uniref:Reductive dehalogenase n=1 Tax=Dehalogenimonas formicexedens TaxID=1839801 RepID=A0A1P8F8B8_9CHLR|nr:reductive dehalogenase [Dehalogenimonas formicexedens]APV44707.1 reductive dehalogenase [Dehalogenimonas formicexedens]
MSMFHSTVSRRQFMKALGLGGAGVGVASLVRPVFHDLDELISSGVAQAKRPWWVKEVDKPTIDIDYTMMTRHDSTLQGQSSYMRAYYLGKERVLATSTTGAAYEKAQIAAGKPGWDTRFQALQNAYKRVAPSANPTWSEATVPTPSKSPSERGDVKWTGTPEEATAMLRMAMRVFGAELVFPFEMTQNEKDHVIFKNSDKANGDQYIDAWPPPDTAARPIVFENVPAPYSTTTKLVIPDQIQLSEISLTMGGANELWRMAPTPIGSLANANTFNNTANCHASTYSFLRYLGYFQIGIIGNDSTYLGSEGGAAILSGLGEASRQQLYTLTPEKGAPGRLYTIATDLPLEPSKPIDAGLWRFCHACHKCADHCPPQTISQNKEPSYDRDAANAGARDPASVPDYAGKTARWAVDGTKCFLSDSPLCRQFNAETGRCLVCWGECTFTTNRGAMVHQVIRAVISNFSALNGQAYKLGDLFGYGCWPRTDVDQVNNFFELQLPVLGHDSTVCAYDGGYNKWEGPPFL